MAPKSTTQSSLSIIPDPQSPELAKETSSWIFYSSSRLRFSVKYPPDYKPEETIWYENGDWVVGSVSFTSEDFIKEIDGPVKKGSRFWISQDTIPITGVIKEPDYKIILDGFEADYFEGRTGHSVVLESPWSSGLQYSIKAEYAAEDEVKVVEDFRKMLALFKFSK